MSLYGLSFNFTLVILWIFHIVLNVQFLNGTASIQVPFWAVSAKCPPAEMYLTLISAVLAGVHGANRKYNSTSDVISLSKAILKKLGSFLTSPSVSYIGVSLLRGFERQSQGSDTESSYPYQRNRRITMLCGALINCLQSKYNLWKQKLSLTPGPRIGNFSTFSLFTSRMAGRFSQRRGTVNYNKKGIRRCYFNQTTEWLNCRASARCAQ